MARNESHTVHLQVRIREDLRQHLEQSAKGRRVSLNQEIVDRLEHVRDRTGLLTEVLKLAHGQRMAGILTALGLVMGIAGRLSARTSLKPREWTDDPELFENAFRAAVSLLEAARPEGAIPDPTGEEDHGLEVVDNLLANIAGEECVLPLAEEAETIKQLLGPVATRMVEADRRRREAEDVAYNAAYVARAVLCAADEIREIKTDEMQEPDTEIPNKLIEVIARHLTDFMIPGWYDRRPIEGEPTAAVADLKRRA